SSQTRTTIRPASAWTTTVRPPCLAAAMSRSRPAEAIIRSGTSTSGIPPPPNERANDRRTPGSGARVGSATLNSQSLTAGRVQCRRGFSALHARIPGQQFLVLPVAGDRLGKGIYNPLREGVGAAVNLD